MAEEQTQELAEWPADHSLYNLIGKIGQGAFASVWKASETTLERECAIKVLNLDHVDSNLSEIRLEVQAMRLSSHPNVLACHTAFVKDTNLWLVTQLMNKGSSLHCLQGARKAYKSRQQQQPPLERHIMYILNETLLGLRYIHENGQIHRDIKAGNILLDGNGEVRIADFGVSGWLVNAGSQQEKAKTFVGTPCWMAPEVMEQIHGYDYKADIWSLGITALELAKGFAPYAKYPPMKVLILTIQDDPPSLDTYDEEGDDDDFAVGVDEAWTNTFRNLVDACLQKYPAKRPATDELLQSNYFSAMQDESTRMQCREAIKREVCDLSDDVGAASTKSSTSGSELPGNSPISIILANEENRQPGTTWVFADGSQVLSSSATPATVDDVMAELDQFGQQTGGEHYARDSSNTPAHAADGGEEHDDLNAFMDEFELNTAGEDFRRD